MTVANVNIVDIVVERIKTSIKEHVARAVDRWVAENADTGLPELYVPYLRSQRS